MKKILIAVTFLCCLTAFSNHALAQKKSSYKTKSAKPKTVRVKSHTTKKGKHVKSHYRSKPTRKKYSYTVPVIVPKEWAV